MLDLRIGRMQDLTPTSCAGANSTKEVLEAELAEWKTSSETFMSQRDTIVKERDYLLEQLEAERSASAKAAGDAESHLAQLAALASSRDAALSAYSGEREHLYRRNVNTHFHTH